MTDDSIFRSLTRPELIDVIGADKVVIIDNNLRAFGDNLRVSMLHEYTDKEQPEYGHWHAKRGRVFLHVIDDHMDWTRDLYRYATDLGFFENCPSICSLIQRYIFTELTKARRKK